MPTNSESAPKIVRCDLARRRRQRGELRRRFASSTPQRSGPRAAIGFARGTRGRSSAGAMARAARQRMGASGAHPRALRSRSLTLPPLEASLQTTFPAHDDGPCEHRTHIARQHPPDSGPVPRPGAPEVGPVAALRTAEPRRRSFASKIPDRRIDFSSRLIIVASCNVD